MGDYTRTDSKKPQGARASSEASGARIDAFKTEDGFKKGGKAEKAGGGCMKKGGKAVMSSAAKGVRPARKSGGSVLSSAASGTPRGKASHY
jgi:hypothetical protein